MHRRVSVWVAVLCAGAALPVVSQDAPPPASAPAGAVSAKAAVQIDVVVRDKKNALVHGLTAADFELSEDGAPQTLVSFGAVDRLPAEAPAAAPSVAAILIQQARQTDARALTHEVVKTFVERNLRPGDVTGIFILDRSVRALQPFTTDLAALKAAAEKTSAFAASAEAAPTRTSEDASAQAVLAALAGSDQRLRGTFSRLERDDGDYMLTHAVIALTDILRATPGRKTLLLITEGLSLEAADQSRFTWVTHAANRANVAIYVLDTSRLRAASSQTASRDEMMKIFQDVQRRNADPTQRNSGMSSIEHGEAMMHMDPQAQMETLAQDTGGFLIRDTHAMAATLSRIDEDRRCHYVLGYTPSNSAYDGRYRKIVVTTKRPGLQLQARRGYFAVRGEGPVLGFEAPALVALERQPLPQDLPLRAGAFFFPESADEARAVVVAETPAAALTFSQDNRVYRTDFAVVARVHRAGSAEPLTLSERYQIERTPDKLEATKKNTLVVFRRETRLGPGRQNLGVVGYDALSAKAGARSLTIEIPEGNALRVSSLVLVKRIDPVKPDDDRDSPLCVKGEAVISPNLGEPISKAQQQALGFYFGVYGATGPAAPPATLEVWRGAAKLAEAPMQLPAPDDKKCIQQVGALPVASIPAGEYELRVRVGEGAAAQTRAAAFTLVD